MKKIFISFILLLFIWGDAISQFGYSCLPEGITFTTQAQIDSLQVNYPGCTAIEGNVTITESVPGNILNLQGLNVLTSIGGDLSICANHLLQDLTGLDNLTSIGGGLGLIANWSLTSLDGLQNLVWIGGISIGAGHPWFSNPLLSDLDAFHNLTSVNGDLLLADDGFTDLSGFENIVTISGDLSLYACFGLTDLSGLENLEYIGGDIYINGDYGLINMNGLNNLDSIGGSLYIGQDYHTGFEPEAPHGNPQLSNLSGLDDLKHIGDDLSIGMNKTLVNLSGLESLENIGRDLYIWNNDSLISLSGLENLDYLSIRDLYIDANVLLSDCDVKVICEYLANSNGMDTIYFNDLGCNSEEEVMGGCLLGAPEMVGVTQYAVRGRPNPFREKTYIEYEIENDGVVNLTIYNHLGQRVSVLVKERQSAGNYSVTWDAEGLPDGIYYCRLQAGNEIGTAKLILMK